MGAAPEHMPPPDAGRTFSAERRVRLSDVTPAGTLRLDAIARYLQDVASDDVDDVGVPGPWVLRRSAVTIEGSPGFSDRVALTTWCSGSGSRWAERRTTISAGGRTLVESVALWVFVDARTGRPARLDPSFFEHYGSAAAGRTVRARLEHPNPPAGLTRRPFALRATDLDLLDHVNNAVFWSPVEEEIRRAGIRPSRAELEYRDALDVGEAVDVVVDDHEPGLLALWLLVGDGVCASARAWTGSRIASSGC
jgi:acyl-ACP thioesterase